MTTHNSTIQQTAIGSKTIAIVFAALFGALLVVGTGLAQSTTLHNAAHDTRHAMGFPCH